MTVSSGIPGSHVRAVSGPERSDSQADSAGFGSGKTSTSQQLRTSRTRQVLPCPPTSAGHGADDETLGALSAVEGPETQTVEQLSHELLAFRAWVTARVLGHQPGLVGVAGPGSAVEGAYYVNAIASILPHRTADDGSLGDRWPSRTSSPCTRRDPHVGLSVAMRITSLQVAAAVGGRPGAGSVPADSRACCARAGRRPQDHSVIISARKTPPARPDRVIEPHRCCIPGVRGEDEECRQVRAMAASQVVAKYSRGESLFQPKIHRPRNTDPMKHASSASSPAARRARRRRNGNTPTSSCRTGTPARCR
jgi:hypothetical protein